MVRDVTQTTHSTGRGARANHFSTSCLVCMDVGRLYNLSCVCGALPLMAECHSFVFALRSSMSLEDPGSISGLLVALKGSDDRAVVDDAVRALWERYFDRFVRPARVRLRHAPRRDAGGTNGGVAPMTFESLPSTVRNELDAALRCVRRRLESRPATPDRRVRQCADGAGTDRAVPDAPGGRGRAPPQGRRPARSP